MTTQHGNPLAVFLPYSFNSQEDYPTEILANRFHAWRYIIKDIVNYLKEYASVQEERVRQQMRLQQAVGISINSSSARGTRNHHHGHGGSGQGTHQNHDDLTAINNFFLPIGNGSIQDLPTILTKFHQQNVTNGTKTLKDINQIVIPKLEELRKDLLVKIKEIKNLQNDFKNNLGKELSETKVLLDQYQRTIEFSNKLDHHSSSSQHSENEQHLKDPYLAKLKLDKQLKRQISEETYLYEAYSNLQSSGQKLESIVVLEIQNYLSTFLNLLNTESSTIPGYLLPNLNNGFLAKDPDCEWNSYISRNVPSSPTSLSALGNNASNVKSGTFVDLSFPARKLSDLAIPEFDNALNVPVREGTLERRSKFLKSYSSGWYVLTCNFIHEFKTPDRKKDLQPVMSLLLDSCVVSEHTKDDGKAGGIYKFVLHSKLLNGIIHKGHNWVFRTTTYQDMIDWYNDIKALTTLSTPLARARFVSKKLNLDTKQTDTTKNKRLSRTASLKSEQTGRKTVTTVHTRSSGKVSSHLPISRTSSRPLSQGPSSNYNRISSTFSQRNNDQSPRLSNMINSDGTIITPLEGVATDGKPSPAVYQNGAQASPQQFAQSPGTFPPHLYYPSPEHGLPVQQFYDPVQQQYYTLSPAINPASQPHYFAPTSKPSSPQIFVPQSGAQPQVIHGQQASQGQIFYPVGPTGVPLYAASLNQDRRSIGETGSQKEPPYPTHSQPAVSISSYDVNENHSVTSSMANGTTEDEGSTAIQESMDNKPADSVLNPGVAPPTTTERDTQEKQQSSLSNSEVETLR